MNGTRPSPQSRLCPADAGQSRTGSAASVVRRLATGAATALAITLTSVVVAAPAHSFLAPNQSTDWIMVADASGDQEVLPAKVNKKGKHVNKVDWAPEHADMTQVHYTWDPAVEDWQEDQHVFTIDLARAFASNPDGRSSGKRTDQIWSAQVWVDGERLLHLTSVHSGGYNNMPRPWVDLAKSPDPKCYYLPSLQDSQGGRVMLLLPSDCLPAGSKAITRIDFASEIVAVNKKNKGTVGVRDTAQIKANIPART